MVQEISFRDIFYLELLQPLNLVEQNHLCNFGREHHDEQIFKITLNLDQRFRRYRLKTFHISSSGRPFVQRSGTICNCGSMHHVEQFCEIVLNQEEMAFYDFFSYLKLLLPFCSAELNH